MDRAPCQDGRLTDGLGRGAPDSLRAGLFDPLESKSRVCSEKSIAIEYCKHTDQKVLQYAYHTQYSRKLEMWANAQRDGRPVEYRWRPLFNAAKFGWRPLLECRAVRLARRESHWNLQGCPKLPHRSQPLVGRSSPYCADMWRRYCCLTGFFPTVDTALFHCEEIAQQSCAMVPRWQFLAIFCVLNCQRAACSKFQTCILHLR